MWGSLRASPFFFLLPLFLFLSSFRYREHHSFLQNKFCSSLMSSPGRDNPKDLLESLTYSIPYA
ncbi:hypothetical protein BOX24_01860 [Leptospirillum ferriphilum]|uniref:Uncharacterized protein n=1 Tax=Leptospirillum ferriphilum TaxID=178606 RepID=A0A1V3SXU9_9BACT|nr:hypothetical protein BOX24_01860 [Leptospirillum ferriphilum]